MIDCSITVFPSKQPALCFLGNIARAQEAHHASSHPLVDHHSHGWSEHRLWPHASAAHGDPQAGTSRERSVPAGPAGMQAYRQQRQAALRRHIAIWHPADALHHRWPLPLREDAREGTGQEVCLLDDGTSDTGTREPGHHLPLRRSARHRRQRSVAKSPAGILEPELLVTQWPHSVPPLQQDAHLLGARREVPDRLHRKARHTRSQRAGQVGRNAVHHLQVLRCTALTTAGQLVLL